MPECTASARRRSRPGAPSRTSAHTRRRVGRRGDVPRSAVGTSSITVARMRLRPRLYPPHPRAAPSPRRRGRRHRRLPRRCRRRRECAAAAAAAARETRRPHPVGKLGRALLACSLSLARNLALQGGSILALLLLPARPRRLASASAPGHLRGHSRAARERFALAVGPRSELEARART